MGGPEDPDNEGRHIKPDPPKGWRTAPTPSSDPIRPLVGSMAADLLPSSRRARIARVTMPPVEHRTRPSATERHIDVNWRQMLAPRSPSSSDPLSGSPEFRLRSEVTSAPASFARVSRA